MRDLFRFEHTRKRDPAVNAWLQQHAHGLGAIACHWFEIIRNSGNDMQEILHDGQPTTCVENAAFAYVDVFTSHVNVGFFNGAYLPDPKRLLVGTGKTMRHVKLRPEQRINQADLTKLIECAYLDIRNRVKA